VGAVAVAATLPWWADPYTTSIATRILALALLAGSVAVLTGHAGLPTLGQTAPFAVGAYATALLARAGHTVGIGHLAASAVAAAVFAAATGVLTLHTRATVHLMVSVAVGQLTVIAADQAGTFTGGTDGISFLPATRPLPGLPELADDRQIYLYAFAVAAATLTATWALLRGPAGNLLRAVRDNEPRARASGHPTNRYLYTAHIAAAILAGLGGSLLVTAQHAIIPADAGFDTASISLLATALGGPGSIVGAVTGTALIIVTRDVIAGPFAGHAPLLLGCLYISCVYLLPNGLAGLVRTLAHRLPGRPRTRPAPAGDPPPAHPAVPAARVVTSPVKPAPAARLGDHAVHGAQPDPGPTLLRISGLTRTYASLIALDHLDLELTTGARHAVIGPNGAGKTTLLHLLAGTVPATSGTVTFAGHDITHHPVHRRARLGLVRTFQHPAAWPRHSTLDNVILGAWPHRHTPRRQLPGAARQLLGELGLTTQAAAPAGALSHGQRRLLEIAIALAARPRLLLLDEPAAGLTPADTDRLITVLRALPSGVTLLLVEHDLDVVAAIADTVTVLHEGRHLHTGTAEQTDQSPAVQAAYPTTTPLAGRP
jgi:ABC-type branched-subunit amino acid transport system ATPase component/ABC-type branched-subunit amino acid transport system permease subunit